MSARTHLLRTFADVIIDDVRVVTVSIALKLLVVVYIVYSIFWLRNFMAIETPTVQKATVLWANPP